MGSTLKYSDGLCRRVAEEASKCSFDECVQSVRLSTGGHTPKRQCEEIVLQVAQDFEDYYDSTVEIGEEKKSNLLVITTDSKGIVMRTEDLRPATQKAAQSAPKSKVRLSPGEKKKALFKTGYHLKTIEMDNLYTDYLAFLIVISYTTASNYPVTRPFR